MANDAPVTRILQLDRTPRVLEPLDLGALHDDAHRVPVDALERGDGTHGGLHHLAFVVEHDALEGCQGEVGERLGFQARRDEWEETCGSMRAHIDEYVREFFSVVRLVGDRLLVVEPDLHRANLSPQARTASHGTDLEIHIPGPIPILRLINLNFHLLTLHRQPAPHPNRLTRADRAHREGPRWIANDSEDVFSLQADVFDLFGEIRGVDDEPIGQGEGVGRAGGDAVPI